MKRVSPWGKCPKLAPSETSSAKRRFVVFDGHMEPVIDTRTAAQLLDVSPRTVERWVSDREIPFFRLGRLVRFRASELETWLQDRHRPMLN